MKYNMDDAVAILGRSPVVLRDMLAGLDEPWIKNNYGKDTFSPFDVLGHLVHGEKEDWLSRGRIILEHGESRPFNTFNRYAMYEDSKDKSINDLLDEFESLRKENLVELDGLSISEEQLSLSGTHPQFGSVTLSQLLATWVAHDLHHIAQVCKALAYQYKDELGPWLEYIGIIPR